MTIIKIRKGINGARYSACDSNGYFLRNFNKLSEVRKNWKYEIKYGRVELVRELNKIPDMSAINGAIAAVESLLKKYSSKK